jgi:hypothetical protein
MWRCCYCCFFSYLCCGSRFASSDFRQKYIVKLGFAYLKKMRRSMSDHELLEHEGAVSPAAAEKGR